MLAFFGVVTGGVPLFLATGHSSLTTALTSPRSLQEGEQGRRRPESAVRAYLTVIDRNPEAVEKAPLNKAWVAKARLPVLKAEASHAERTPMHRGATLKKPEPATDRTR